MARKGGHCPVHAHRGPCRHLPNVLPRRPMAKIHHPNVHGGLRPLARRPIGAEVRPCQTREGCGRRQDRRRLEFEHGRGVPSYFNNYLAQAVAGLVRQRSIVATAAAATEPASEPASEAPTLEAPASEAPASEAPASDSMRKWSAAEWLSSLDIGDVAVAEALRTRVSVGRALSQTSACSNVASL